MIKVVIDTNILIGGSYDENSVAFKIVEEVIEGKIMAFATHKTMRENKSLLGQTVTDEAYRDRLQGYFRRLQIVRRSERLDVINDKEDNKLFESAVVCNADFLITNDREVLDVGEYEGVEVVTPEEFWVRYDTESTKTAWSDWTEMLMGK